MTKSRIKRVEIYEGPDDKGRYHHARFWMADYHPGHPDGEHRLAERGQHFNCPLPEDAGEVVDMRKGVRR